MKERTDPVGLLRRKRRADAGQQPAINRYRHLGRIEVRYAGWDLGLIHLVDECTGMVLGRLYPQDKTQNASGLGRSLDPIANGIGFAQRGTGLVTVDKPSS